MVVLTRSGIRSGGKSAAAAASSKIGVGCLISALALGGGVARGQTISPSQVTPRELRPAASSSATITLPSAAGLVAPANAAGLSLTLGQVVVEGGFAEFRTQSAAITDRITHARITVADIYQAASALEKAYASAGYVLARVVVPPQKLVNGGTLRLIVVDGFIEAIDAKGVPNSQRHFVETRVGALIGRRHVTLSEIERQLLLASDDPGLGLRSTLTPGAAPGAANLVLEATHQALTGAFEYNNYEPRSLGISSLNSALQLNSPFGFGEQIYFTATTGYDLGKVFGGTSPLQVFGGGFSLPIGVDGLVINPEYTNSVTRPIAAAGTPASVGYFQRLDIRASYPILRTRAQTLTLSSTIEWDEEHLVPVGFGFNLYQDQYFVGRLTADDVALFSGGAYLESIGEFSQGLGGRAASDVPLSQFGASPDFSKLDLTLRWTQPLPESFQLALLGEGQTSFGQPLMISEQMVLGGPTAVSGFPIGEFNVDEGALLRAELGRSFALPVNGVFATLAPYIFGAGGRGFIDQPTAVQQSTIDAGALGLGVRTSVNAAGVPVGATLALEGARFYSDVPGEREGWRGNVSFAVKF